MFNFSKMIFSLKISLKSDSQIDKSMVSDLLCHWCEASLNTDVL